MKKLFLIMLLGLCLLVSCGQPVKKARSEMDVLVNPAKYIPVSKSVTELIEAYARRDDYLREYTINSIFKYAHTSRNTDVYVVQFLEFYDNTQPDLGGNDDIAIFEILGGKILNCQRYITYHGVFTSEDTTKEFENFPGLKLPYGSCYDFNNDGREEIAIVSYGGIGASLQFFTTRTNSDMKADYEYEELVCMSEIPIWLVPEEIPRPVQWCTYKGRPGFKVYYEARGSEWPEDNSLPKPWFVDWNKTSKQFEPLEEMNE